MDLYFKYFKYKSLPKIIAKCKEVKKTTSLKQNLDIDEAEYVLSCFGGRNDKLYLTFFPSKYNTLDQSALTLREDQIVFRIELDFSKEITMIEGSENRRPAITYGTVTNIELGKYGKKNGEQFTANEIVNLLYLPQYITNNMKHIYSTIILENYDFFKEQKNGRNLEIKFPDFFMRNIFDSMEDIVNTVGAKSIYMPLYADQHIALTRISMDNSGKHHFSIMDSSGAFNLYIKNGNIDQDCIKCDQLKNFVNRKKENYILFPITSKGTFPQKDLHILELEEDYRDRLLSGTCSYFTRSFFHSLIKLMQSNEETKEMLLSCKEQELVNIYKIKKFYSNSIVYMSKLMRQSLIASNEKLTRLKQNCLKYLDNYNLHTSDHHGNIDIINHQERMNSLKQAYNENELFKDKFSFDHGNMICKKDIIERCDIIENSIIAYNSYIEDSNITSSFLFDNDEIDKSLINKSTVMTSKVQNSIINDSSKIENTHIDDSLVNNSVLQTTRVYKPTTIENSTLQHTTIYEPTIIKNSNLSNISVGAVSFFNNTKINGNPESFCYFLSDQIMDLNNLEIDCSDSENIIICDLEYYCNHTWGIKENVYIYNPISQTITKGAYGKQIPFSYKVNKDKKGKDIRFFGSKKVNFDNIEFDDNNTGKYIITTEEYYKNHTKEFAKYMPGYTVCLYDEKVNNLIMQDKKNPPLKFKIKIRNKKDKDSKLNNKIDSTASIDNTSFIYNSKIGQNTKISCSTICDIEDCTNNTIHNSVIKKAEKIENSYINNSTINNFLIQKDSGTVLKKPTITDSTIINNSLIQGSNIKNSYLSNVKTYGNLKLENVCIDNKSKECSCMILGNDSVKLKNIKINIKDNDQNDILIITKNFLDKINRSKPTDDCYIYKKLLKNNYNKYIDKKNGLTIFSQKPQNNIEITKIDSKYIFFKKDIEKILKELEKNEDSQYNIFKQIVKKTKIYFIKQKKQQITADFILNELYGNISMLENIETKRELINSILSEEEVEQQEQLNNDAQTRTQLLSQTIHNQQSTAQEQENLQKIENKELRALNQETIITSNNCLQYNNLVSLLLNISEKTENGLIIFEDTKNNCKLQYDKNKNELVIKDKMGKTEDNKIKPNMQATKQLRSIINSLIDLENKKLLENKGLSLLQKRFCKENTNFKTSKKGTLHYIDNQSTEYTALGFKDGKFFKITQLDQYYKSGAQKIYFKKTTNTWYGTQKIYPSDEIVKVSILDQDNKLPHSLAEESGLVEDIIKEYTIAQSLMKENYETSKQLISKASENNFGILPTQISKTLTTNAKIDQHVYNK